MKNWIFQTIILLYFRIKFRKLNSEKRTDVYFSRGTFKHDINIFTSEVTDVKPVVLDMNLIRRLLRLIIPDLYLEQIISLGYQEILHARLERLVKYWVDLTKKNELNLIFGGVDYFEVSIFFSREIFGDKTKYIAYFHENYTIPYVEEVSINLYRDVKHKHKFDELYVYGPSSFNILLPFTLEANGPKKLVMPRLLNIMKEFTERKIRTGKVKVLYLTFPGYDYLAPLTFSNILLSLNEISHNYEIFAKFKNINQANYYKNKIDNKNSEMKFVDGNVLDFLKKTDIVISFNSLSFYEALLSDALIIIPRFSDTDHANNILQETDDSLNEIYEFKTVVFAYSIEELIKYISNFERKKHGVEIDKEKKYRKELLSKKFYI